tara:strand:+ start:9 stop:473 length:465 start_codon:yes stop_codon:yes gene_type:complete
MINEEDIKQMTGLRSKGYTLAKIALEFGLSSSYVSRLVRGNVKRDRTQEAFKLKEKRNYLKRRLVEYKGGKCEVCGYNKSIRALEFHHSDPKKKKINISTELFQKKSPNEKLYKRLKKETEKCLLVCRNCHAEIHQGLVQADGKRLERKITKKH